MRVRFYQMMYRRRRRDPVCLPSLEGKAKLIKILFVLDFLGDLCNFFCVGFCTEMKRSRVPRTWGLNAGGKVGRSLEKQDKPGNVVEAFESCKIRIDRTGVLHSKDSLIPINLVL